MAGHTSERLLVLNGAVAPLKKCADLFAVVEHLRAQEQRSVILAPWGAHHTRPDGGKKMPIPDLSSQAKAHSHVATHLGLAMWCEDEHGSQRSLNVMLAQDAMDSPVGLPGGIVVVGSPEELRSLEAVAGDADYTPLSVDYTEEGCERTKKLMQEAFVDACPSRISYKDGDLCDASELVVAHQCNLVTDYAAGVAKAIFQRFPEADCYGSPRPLSLLGTSATAKSKGKVIVNMFAQIHGGAAGADGDGEAVRAAAFRKAIRAALRVASQLGSAAALPQFVGCGMAGGDWDAYFAELQTAATEEDAEIVLYSKKQDPACCICAETIASGQHDWHVSMEAPCCRKCVTTCRHCGDAAAELPTADEPPLGGRALRITTPGTASTG